MTDEQIAAQANEQDILEALSHPDPDPDTLPAIPADFALQEHTAVHILRASLVAEYNTTLLKQRMQADMAAWGAMIAKAEQRTKQYRDLVRQWMLRCGVTKLQHPAFTASIGTGRRTIVVDDEAACITIAKGVHAQDCIKVKESLDKKEFNVLFESRPSLFTTETRAAHEEVGEPTLIVRRRQA